MKEYHKIQSIFKRNMQGDRKLIEGEFSLPEFEYLKNNTWVWTEKVDGTNIRVMWTGDEVKFGGRTANAQIPTYLYDKLNEIFKSKIDKFIEIFGDFNTPPEGEMEDVCLFGEGYGAKIQKGGGNYKADGVDFVLFDVSIGGWWLKREDVEDIANKLGLSVVPIIEVGTITRAIELIKSAPISTWGDFRMEGLVLRPKVELKTRSGHRIITKIKCKDF